MKKTILLLISISLISPLYSATIKKVQSNPDRIVLTLCQSFPDDVKSKLSTPLRESLKSDPDACAAFILSFVSSYLNMANDEMSKCKSIIKFPMRGHDISICGQEL